LQEDAAVHTHFLGRFGPNKPEKKDIQGDAKPGNYSSIPGVDNCHIMDGRHIFPSAAAD
jgi:hypothetical protein